MKFRMNRRSFLRGAANTAIGLPLLEGMFHGERALAQTGKAPLRFAFLYYGNGAVGYEMSARSVDGYTGVLSSLAPHRSNLISVNGLTNRDNSTWGKNGAGDGGGTPHELEAATFLTCRPLPNRGELRVQSPSIDQLIGARLQAQYKSKNASVMIGDGAGCTGFAQGQTLCAFHYLMSWKSPTEYALPISSVRTIFDTVFSSSAAGSSQPDPALELLRAQKRSILDSTRSQVQSMKSRLGSSDGNRLEEFLQSVRDVEAKVSEAPLSAVASCPGSTAPGEIDASKIANFDLYTRTMIDLMVLGFQCQTTPVFVFQLTRGNGYVRTGQMAGVSEDQHQVSHYRSAGTQDKLRKINDWYTQRYAYLLKRLTETQELGEPMIRNVVSAFGSAIADADAHDGGNCPMYIGGGQNHGVVSGRVIDRGLKSKNYGEGTPLANLFLSLGNLAGVPTAQFGNSNGTLPLTA